MRIRKLRIFTIFFVALVLLAAYGLALYEDLRVQAAGIQLKSSRCGGIVGETLGFETALTGGRFQ